MHARVLVIFATMLLATGCRPKERHRPPPSARTTGSKTHAVASTVPPARTSASAVASVPAPASASSASSSASSTPSASAPAQLPPPPCPPEMAKVGRSCVDRWEAHLVVLRNDGVTASHSPYERPEDGVRYGARSAAGTIPQAYINRIEAKAACEAAGKRLCSLFEWYRACRGPRGFMYPYGPRMDRRACNVSKPHILSRLHGSNPGNWKYDEHFNDPKLNQEPGFLARCGEYERCVSGYGVADMVGNLHEWISDHVGPSLAGKIPLREDIHDKLDDNAGNAIFMGGFYSTTSEHGRGCAFVTIGHGRKYHDYSTGFRCCKDARKSPEDE